MGGRSDPEIASIQNLAVERFGILAAECVHARQSTLPRLRKSVDPAG